MLFTSIFEGIFYIGSGIILVYGLIKAIVKLTPTKKDDEILDEFESSEFGQNFLDTIALFQENKDVIKPHTDK